MKYVTLDDVRPFVLNGWWDAAESYAREGVLLEGVSRATLEVFAYGGDCSAAATFAVVEAIKRALANPQLDTQP